MGHKPLITPQPSHFHSDQGSGRAPAGLMGGAGPYPSRPACPSQHSPAPWPSRWRLVAWACSGSTGV